MTRALLKFATVCCLSFPVLALAQKTLRITLQDAIYLALRNNPDVRQADIQRIADKYALVVAKNEFQPQYQLNSNWNYFNSSSQGEHFRSNNYNVTPSVSIKNHYGTQFSVSMDNSVNSPGDYNPGVKFSVFQPLIKGFGKPVVDATLENAIDQEHINQLNYRQTAMSTIVKTVGDYFNLVAAVQSLQISEVSLQQNEQTIKNDKMLIKAGRMAGADIIQAKAQVATTKSTIETNKNDIKSAKEALLDNLGLSPNMSITIPNSFEFKKMVHLISGGHQLPNPNVSEKLALAANTAYQVARISIYTLERGLLVAKNNSKWELDLNASATRGNGFGGGDNAGLRSIVNSRNYSNEVGLSLSVPIDNVNNKAAVINAEVGLEKAKIALRESRRSLIESVKTQVDNLQTSKTQVALSRQALYLQEETYHVSKEKFLAGKISNFELLTQQQNLDQAKNTLLGSEITYLNAIVTFENEIGIALQPWHVRVRY